MTLSDMRTHFWELIQESSSDTAFPSATVNRWLNLALERASMEALYYEKAYALSTTSGTREVNVPSDFIVSKELHYETGGTRKELCPVKYPVIAVDYTTTGTPEFYSIRAGQIVLDPVPNVTGSTLKGYYVAKETALSGDSDSPQLPAQYQGYLIHYAVYLSLLSDGQTQLAQPHLLLWQEGIRQLTNEFWDDRVRRNMNMFREWARPTGQSIAGGSGGEGA